MLTDFFILVTYMIHKLNLPAVYYS